MTLFAIGLMFLLVLGIMTSTSVQSSSGVTFGGYENRIDNQANIFSYYFGILEFTEIIDDDDDFISCSNIEPRIKTDVIEISNEPLLNIDEMKDEFFIILSHKGSDSYEYLQIALPERNGSPSYLVDVKKHPDQTVTGALYQTDYSHLAFVFESDSRISVISEENHYEKYFAGDSTSLVTPSERLGPGSYDFHAVLFQSDKSNGINKDRCAISLHWEFSVDDNAMILTTPPQTKVGKIGIVTEKFPPLKQYKMGMGLSQIECKPGHGLIEQENHSDNKRVACVTPETKTKLIEREWTMRNNNDDSYSNNEIKSIESETQEISLLSFYQRFDHDGVTEIINPKHKSIEYESASP